MTQPATGVRPVRPSDRDEWIRMRTRLWPDRPQDHPPEVDAWLVDPPAGERGCTEMASDAAVDNLRSVAVHEALGYDEVVRAVCFRKTLG